jgi:hypothetical protein
MTAMRAARAAASGASSILATARGVPAARVLALAAALAAALWLFAPGGDRMPSEHAAVQVKLPPLMLWAWDRSDDLRFLDAPDTGVAFLAATVRLRGAGVALEPRHNPIMLPERIPRAAVVHVETERAEPPTLSRNQLRRFVDALGAVATEVPNDVLQIDFEALASQRVFLIDAIAGLRERVPGGAISATALASWCFNESWTGRLAADEVVPMLFRMGYDGRKVRAQLENGGDFRSEACRSSLGVATDELPAVLPRGRRIYVFNPRRWSAETYNLVRARLFR